MLRFLKITGVLIVLVVGLGATVWAFGLWRSVIEIESQQEAQAEDSAQATRLLQQALEQRKVLGPEGRFAVAFYDCDLYRLEPTQQRWLPVNLDFGQAAASPESKGCRSAELQRADEYLMAIICEQALGTSGGCSRFGVFRSRDGQYWERKRQGPKGEFWLQGNSP